MRIKGLRDEDFVNYKKPCMFISTATCSFKCDKEWGEGCCQNSPLAHAPVINIEDDVLIKRYINNPISKCIVFSGQEPLDQIDEQNRFINKLRNQYHCDDDIVIFTGYYPEEVEKEIDLLKNYPNQYVKYGRFIPNQPSHFDDVLGIPLASINQFGVQIS